MMRAVVARETDIGFNRFYIAVQLCRFSISIDRASQTALIHSFSALLLRFGPPVC